MLAPQLKAMGIEFDASIFPPAEKIRKHLLPYVAVVRQTQSGITLTERTACRGSASGRWRRASSSACCCRRSRRHTAPILPFLGDEGGELYRQFNLARETPGLGLSSVVAQSRKRLTRHRQPSGRRSPVAVLDGSARIADKTSQSARTAQQASHDPRPT